MYGRGMTLVTWAGWRAAESVGVAGGATPARASRPRSGGTARARWAKGRDAATCPYNWRMFRRFATLVAVVLLLAAPLEAQTRKRVPAKKAPVKKAVVKPPAKKIDPAEVTCPAQLGTGVASKALFCDVLTSRTAPEGVRIAIPPHKGETTLIFDLHNRHTYSEQLVKSGRGFADYTATIIVASMDGYVLGRGVVTSQFRTVKDLLDRVSGGAAGGVKAVAPIGAETIVVPLAADVTEVSLVGEKLTVRTLDGVENYASPGRPIAVVSNVQIEYVPGPPPKTPAPKR